MVSIETEARIAKILLILAEGERNIEISRQVLSDNNDYDAYQIFKFLDFEGKNRIDACNIIEFLRTKGIYVNLIEINLIILFYDQDCDGSLSFLEFLNLIQSEKSKPIPKVLNSNNISYNIEYSLIKLLQKEIELSKNLLIALNELKTRYDFNIHNIFHSLKSNCFIDEESIKRFLKRNSARAIKSDIKSILKRLDINKDGKIDLCEFHTFLGYPECQKCCSNICCCNCGCICCNFCQCEQICSVHHCIHRRNCCIPNFQNYNYLNNYNSVSNENFNNGNQLKVSNESYFNNNYEDSQASTFFKSGNMNKGDFSGRNDMFSVSEVQKLSPNLSLRLSPQRQFVPKTSYRNPNVNNNFNNNINNYNNNIDKNNYNNIDRNFNNHLDNNFNDNYNNFENNNFNPENNFNENINNQFDNFNNNQFYNNNNMNSNKKFNPNEMEESQFNDYLISAMNFESKIEKAKINLACQNDFNCEDAFRIFELDSRNFITEDDLKYGLNQLGINPSDIEIKLLMKRFDLEKEGIINFSDFFDMIVPYEKDYRNMVENKLPNSCCHCKCPDIFNSETKSLMKKVFELLIDSEKKLNEMKKNYASLRVVLNDIFKFIDVNELGFFKENDLNSYLKEIDGFNNMKDCDLLFIRLDKNRDGKVEYYEIEDEFKL